MTTTSKTVGTSSSTSSDLFRPSANPFLVVAPAASVVTEPSGYALFASGPAVDADEVEIASAAAVEVRIAWGETQLHVAHLDNAKSFYVGEEQGKNIKRGYSPFDLDKKGLATPMLLPPGERAIDEVQQKFAAPTSMDFNRESVRPGTRSILPIRPRRPSDQR